MIPTIEALPVTELRVGDVVLSERGKPEGTVTLRIPSCGWNKVHAKTTAGTWCYDAAMLVSVVRD
jgi:hypothetical protein